MAGHGRRQQGWTGASCNLSRRWATETGCDAGAVRRRVGFGKQSPLVCRERLVDEGGRQPMARRDGRQPGLHRGSLFWAPPTDHRSRLSPASEGGDPRRRYICTSAHPHAHPHPRRPSALVLTPRLGRTVLHDTMVARCTLHAAALHSGCPLPVAHGPLWRRTAVFRWSLVVGRCRRLAVLRRHQPSPVPSSAGCSLTPSALANHASLPADPRRLLQPALSLFSSSSTRPAPACSWPWPWLPLPLCLSTVPLPPALPLAL
jgi:hypothetical protein